MCCVCSRWGEFCRQGVETCELAKVEVEIMRKEERMKVAVAVAL